MNDRLFGVFVDALEESDVCCFGPADGRGRARSCGFDCSIAGKHRRIGREGRRPVPRQQFCKARARPALGHLVDDAGQVGVGIEAIQFSGFNNRIDVRRAPAAFVAAEEKVIFSCDRDGPEGAFRRVVVDGKAAVARIADKRIPATQAVLDCFGQRGFLRQSLSFAFEPRFQFVEQRHGAGLSHGEPLSSGFSIDRRFDLVELADPAQCLGCDPRFGLFVHVEEVPPRVSMHAT